MEEGKEPPISKLFTIKRPMNKYKKKDAPPSDCNGDRVVTVSEFDYCVDNHFRAIETISKLCGEDDEDYYALQQTKIQRLSSSLAFLRQILNNAPLTTFIYVCMYVCVRDMSPVLLVLLRWYYIYQIYDRFSILNRQQEHHT